MIQGKARDRETTAIEKKVLRRKGHMGLHGKT
jgi:hypothetical protein